MLTRSRSRLAMALLLVLAATGQADASPWSDAQTPSAGPARAIGTPVAGCLAGGAALAFDGPGFQVIRLSRHRYFGHPATIAFIEKLGASAQAQALPDFYVGDMALPR